MVGTDRDRVVDRGPAHPGFFSLPPEIEDIRLRTGRAFVEPLAAARGGSRQRTTTTRIRLAAGTACLEGEGRRLWAPQAPKVSALATATVGWAAMYEEGPNLSIFGPVSFKQTTV